MSNEPLFDVTISYPYEGDTTYFSQTVEEVKSFLNWNHLNHDDIRISPSKPQWEPREWLKQFGGEG